MDGILLFLFYMHLDRNDYLARLKPWIGKPVIKVLTGLRRVGKSTLLQQLATHLREEGVPQKRIHLFNMELMAHDSLREALAFHHHLTAQAGKVTANKPHYLLIDEVQEIAGWERLTASLLAEGGWDITLTGSNAHLLSSELATLLSGRYVQFQILPLGLGDFMQLRNQAAPQQAEAALDDYLRHGGMPGLHHLEWEPEIIHQYLDAVFNTLLYKDVVARFELRNTALLERLTRFAVDSIGTPLSANSIAQFLKSQRISVSVTTVQEYLHALESSFLLQRIQRYDIRGKRHLEVNDKFYLGDTGLRQAIVGYRQDDVGAVLENLVYLELLRRDYTVSAGKIGDREIDFVAERTAERHYIQVAYQLGSEKTVEREFGVFDLLEDHYPRTVISLDRRFGPGRNGVRHLYAADFLGGKPLE
jgi:predicted AAA+ superfamily ATPase